MRFLVGNWKMNGDVNFAREYTHELLQSEAVKNMSPQNKLITCPPAIWLHELAGIVAGSNMELGGQDCHFAMSGAFTGDISAQMLKDSGCEYVIVGHSERRANHCENDSLVAQKANAAFLCELTPIICLGETKEQRNSGEHKSAIRQQIRKLLAEIIPHHSLMIAYEPVWAIGTGKIPTIEEIEEMFSLIIDECRRHGIYLVNLLYGGSVNSNNAAALFAIENLSGVLVGNASTQLQQWTEIIKAANG